tara:strand:+ start:179 stop:532 length:354 start_codon:yes stop_codon:yes gene_type:complete
MNEPPTQTLLLKRKETEEMFGPYLNVSGNCYSIMNDLMNGLVSVPDRSDTLELLCEYVSACKLTRIALSQIFREENMLKEQQYQVESFQIETLRGSWTLLKALRAELSSVNLSLLKH